MNNFFKHTWAHNKFGIIVMIIAILFLVYGELTSTRIFGGSNTENWSPEGKSTRTGTHNRIYHK